MTVTAPATIPPVGRLYTVRQYRQLDDYIQYVSKKSTGTAKGMFFCSGTVQGPNKCHESDGQVPRKRRSSSARVTARATQVTVKYRRGTHASFALALMLLSNGAQSSLAGSLATS